MLLRTAEQREGGSARHADAAPRRPLPACSSSAKMRYAKIRGLPLPAPAAPGRSEGVIMRRASADLWRCGQPPRCERWQVSCANARSELLRPLIKDRRNPARTEVAHEPAKSANMSVRIR